MMKSQGKGVNMQAMSCLSKDSLKLADLVDVESWDGVVERAVEIIQQFDDLYRTTFRR